jgi:hypothetical protein
MKKLLPILLAAIAIAIGAAGGFFLRASGVHSAPGGEDKTEQKEVAHAAKGEAHGAKDDAHGKKSDAAVYMKFSRQFVTPIVAEGRPMAMMILDVNIEIDPALADTIYAEEPRLRDGVLKALLRQSGAGRLGSIFADPAVLEETRREILEEMRAIVGDGAKSVLIMDVGYQKL